MSNTQEKDKNDNQEEKWTLMFYFASDNPLAPNVVTQLKAITNAGFHQNVNVLCHFDPESAGTDTHIFDVNMVNKLLLKTKSPEKRYKFWGENDPYIRNMIFDKLWSNDEKYGEEKRIREGIAEVLAEREKGLVYDPPDPTKKNPRKKKFVIEGKSESCPKESLQAFLEFCVDSYPAEHYMLFMLGHGLIVGNDMAMYDQHAQEHSLSLKDLAEVLERFTDLTDQKKLDLISFHSCSMSSVEVAYELRDSARYMLASQGPAWVGSWPYREILIRLFNDKIAREKRGDNPPTIASTVERIFEYVLRFSYDFQLAGYSFDLCLCKLDAVDQVTSRLYSLSTALTECLKKQTPLVKEAILLAHWEAQSFWQDSYTDLYDFCSCLKRRCELMAKSSTAAAGYLDPIARKCQPIIDAFESDGRKGSFREYNDRVGNGSIVRSAFAGPAYQYSHGLSVYFPWAEPVNQLFWNKEYKKSYAFVQTGWAEFLQTYFDETQREDVSTEVENRYGKDALRPQTKEEEVLEEITRQGFNEKGPMNRMAVPELDEKPGSGSSTGGGDGKPGSSSSTGGGDGKPGSSSSTGGGDEKPGSGSSTGGGDGKPGSSSSTGGGDGKAGSGSSMGGGKPGGDSSQGGDCDCPSIKNYPSFTRRRRAQESSAENPRETASIEFFSYLINLLEK